MCRGSHATLSIWTSTVQVRILHPAGRAAVCLSLPYYAPGLDKAVCRYDYARGDAVVFSTCSFLSEVCRTADSQLWFARECLYWYPLGSLFVWLAAMCSMLSSRVPARDKWRVEPVPIRNYSIECACWCKTGNCEGSRSHQHVECGESKDWFYCCGRFVGFFAVHRSYDIQLRTVEMDIQHCRIHVRQWWIEFRTGHIIKSCDDPQWLGESWAHDVMGQLPKSLVKLLGIYVWKAAFFCTILYPRRGGEVDML